MNIEVLPCTGALGGGILKMSKVTKLHNGWSTDDSNWNRVLNASPPATALSPQSKELPTNTSMDSGVAGLRDTPVHTPGPNVSGVVTNDDYEIAQFIVDPTTRTTYMKQRFLGKGGFARVHELTDLTTSQTFAGKIIPKSRITKPHHKEKIAREIEVHRRLRHRNVVRFHHYFEDDANVYILLENCTRRSLVHVLKHRSALTEPEVRYYMAQLSEGVSYIHSKGVIHRDLKLGNMFLSEDLTVKIGDFGLAKRASDSATVTVCGTPNYIAPEVLNKLGHSYEADIWAMGCIMYALLLGKPPFETDTLKQTYARINANKYVIPSCVSDSARQLIRAFLHPEPSARPKLDNILSHEFFTTGVMPRSLPPSSCTQVPKFGLEVIGKSSSVPEELSSHDIKKLTTSVSTLRIPNPKQQQDKINILEGMLGSPSRCALVKEVKKEGTFSSCLKQKLSSVICTTDNKSSVIISKKKEITSGTLYNLMAACLDNMPDDMSKNPPVSNESPLFISKWIDYSNKYGFGYQMSDGSVGVFFNDLTRISINYDKSRVEFHDSNGRMTVHQSNALPAWLQERYQLLRYFATYMDENLTEAGDARTSQHRISIIPHVKRWDRTPKSIIMQLSNGTFQINFFKDHTKIVIAGDRLDILVMFIGSDRTSFSYRLSEIAEVGCDAIVRERMVYALSCLRQYAELDGEEV